MYLQEEIETLTEAEVTADTCYTNEDHDPCANLPWNQRQHYRFKGGEEDCSIPMSPLSPRIPLSPPQHWDPDRLECNALALNTLADRVNGKHVTEVGGTLFLSPRVVTNANEGTGETRTGVCLPQSQPNRSTPSSRQLPHCHNVVGDTSITVCRVLVD